MNKEGVCGNAPQLCGQTSDHRLVVVDPATNREYVLVSTTEFEELQGIEAIRKGIAQMEAGKAQPLAGVMNDIRNKLE